MSLSMTSALRGVNYSCRRVPIVAAQPAAQRLGTTWGTTSRMTVVPFFSPDWTLSLLAGHCEPPRACRRMATFVRPGHPARSAGGALCRPPSRGSASRQLTHHGVSDPAAGEPSHPVLVPWGRSRHRCRCQRRGHLGAATGAGCAFLVAACDVPVVGLVVRSVRGVFVWKALARFPTRIWARH